MNNKKIITIITVVFNNVSQIEKTIKSVINQSFKKFEYIIIDGGSTDGTLDIVNKFEENIDIIISEHDNGIFDAMNKGISKASGEYINFMNSGDTFFDNNVINNIVNFIFDNNKPDLIFGIANRIYENYIVKSPNTLNKLKLGVQPCHQATFVKTSVLKNIEYFDLKYKNNSDFDFFCKIFKFNYSYKHIDIIIANYLTGGHSSKNKILGHTDRYNIIKKNFGLLYGFKFYFRRIILEQGLKKILKIFKLDFLLLKLTKMNNKRGKY